MFRKHLSQQRYKEPHQLDITPFLNLMVALVPFLLVTAVFSRVAILELNLPNAEVQASNENKLVIEIIIREDELELSDGNKVLSRYKKSSSGYDLAGLAETLVSIKEKNPHKTDATILLERKIRYDHLVAVMDVVRAKQPDDSSEYQGVKDDDTQAKGIILFPDISIGDAP
jgi:biopolymer transport protein ExbD